MSIVLELDQVNVAYGEHAVIHALSFQLKTSDIGCLLGPSGCGKTTLLRAIAGFESLSDGWIYLDGKVVSRDGFTIAPERREIGMVFQDYALFPHLNVADNIGFGLRKLNAAQRRARVQELLDLIDLRDYPTLYPHQLSGGQQQRVALARALAPRPKMLLLDEPFSSMDVDLREGLAREVRNVLKQEGISALLVTHDQNEAFAMADQIGVLDQGRLQQWADGYTLYHQPANRFVADFIGQGVLIRGCVLNAHQVETEMGIIDGQIPPSCAKGCQVDLLIRPDDIVYDKHAQLLGEVIDKAFRGAHYLYTLQLQSGVNVLSLMLSHHDYALGERVGIRLDADHVVIFKRQGAPPSDQEGAIIAE